MQTEQEEQYLTVYEVAARLRVTGQTVREWLKSGKLTGFCLSDRAGWRIRAVDLQRFVADQPHGRRV